MSQTFFLSGHPTDLLGFAESTSNHGKPRRCISICLDTMCRSGMWWNRIGWCRKGSLGCWWRRVAWMEVSQGCSVRRGSDDRYQRAIRGGAAEDLYERDIEFMCCSYIIIVDRTFTSCMDDEAEHSAIRSTPSGPHSAARVPRSLGRRVAHSEGGCRTSDSAPRRWSQSWFSSAYTISTMV